MVNITLIIELEVIKQWLKKTASCHGILKSLYYIFIFIFCFFYFLDNEEVHDHGHMMHHMTLCHKPRTL